MTLELSLLFVIASVLWIQPRLLAEAESSHNWSSSVTFFSLLSGEINYCLVTGNHFSLLKQITQGSYVCASPLSGIYFRRAVVPGFWRRALDRVFPGCLFSWYLPVILFLYACGGGDEPSTSPLPAIALCFVKDWSSSRGQTDWRAEEGLCHLLSPESIRSCQPGGCCRVAHCHLTWV